MKPDDKFLEEMLEDIRVAAVKARDAAEKRHQLYGAISVIMVMLSEIEGKWRGKEVAR